MPVPINRFQQPQDYTPILKAMLEHIDNQLPCTIWVLEHLPVYTMGKRSLPEHIKDTKGIPLHPTDRGGQVTYHGPGQLIVYPLINLKKWNISPLELVSILEDTTIASLKVFNIEAFNDPDARGVYICGEKIASIGLKIRQGYAYHGIAINIHLDLAPFENIVPCGNSDMKMTQLSLHTELYAKFEELWLKMLLDKLQAARYNSQELCV
jgi:lipoyl(octanoyl) transferase